MARRRKVWCPVCGGTGVVPDLFALCNVRCTEPRCRGRGWYWIVAAVALLVASLLGCEAAVTPATAQPAQPAPPVVELVFEPPPPQEVRCSQPVPNGPIYCGPPRPLQRRSRRRQFATPPGPWHQTPTKVRLEAAPQQRRTHLRRGWSQVANENITWCGELESNLDPNKVLTGRQQLPLVDCRLCTQVILRHEANMAPHQETYPSGTRNERAPGA